MRKTASLLLALIVTAMLMASCQSAPSSSAVLDISAAASSSPSSSASASSEAQHEPITMLLAAAASLEYSFAEQLIPMFQQQYPWITVEGTYASSGNLQTQIEEGLAADVFMSAAMKQMNALVDEGLVDSDSVVKLLENEIVLIAPADSDTAIVSFGDIVNAGSIALGDPESVPVGQYAQEALTSLGVWDSIQSKVSFGTDVTQVLNWVAEGSADVGIVYATDAATTDKVRILATAPEGSLQSKVIYPVGVLSEAPHAEAAQLFVAFLQTPKALAVFENYGFKPNV